MRKPIHIGAKVIRICAMTLEVQLSVVAHVNHVSFNSAFQSRIGVYISKGRIYESMNIYEGKNIYIHINICIHINIYIHIKGRVVTSVARLSLVQVTSRIRASNNRALL